MDRQPIDPDLAGVTRALLREGAEFVVIGGFAVIANDYVRATEDVDLLIPEDAANDRSLERALRVLDASWVNTGRPCAEGDLDGRDHSRLWTRSGLVDLLREGAPPLDYATVRDRAHRGDLGAGPFAVAGLASVVAFKRLAGRPRDKADLDELAAIHGELPHEPLPGLDDAP